MTEDNDLLLRQFFSEAAQQKIEDNGFTERVMQCLEANQQAQSSKLKVQIAYGQPSAFWWLSCCSVLCTDGNC